MIDMLVGALGNFMGLSPTVTSAIGGGLGCVMEGGDFVECAMKSGMVHVATNMVSGYLK